MVAGELVVAGAGAGAGRERAERIEEPSLRRAAPAIPFSPRYGEEERRGERSLFLFLLRLQLPLQDDERTSTLGPSWAAYWSMAHLS
jgi:hypothetical protein